jgi:hypothetical protein
MAKAKPPMTKPKTDYMRMKDLKLELHWFQMLVRLDTKSVERSKEAVQRVAAEMRKVQGRAKKRAS